MRLAPRHVLLLATACALLGLPLAASESPDPALHVAPDGDPQGACSASAPCTLERARTLLRGRPRPLAAAVHVYLHGGTYTLEAPFVLSVEDSGSPGAPIVYTAAPGETPILSGGLPITGPWERLEGPGGLYRAPVRDDLQSRQVYVDGRRQQRARGSRRPESFLQQGTGYCVPEPLRSWDNPREIELVFYWNWQIHRCLIDSIDGGGPQICPPGLVHATVDPACVAHAEPHRLALVEWIENARELLDEEGEFYLDPPTQLLPRYLYLKPTDGRDPALSQVVVAYADRLLEVEGIPGRLGIPSMPVHDIELRGITFTEATWHWPTPHEGYSPAQAGVLKVGGTGGERMNGAVSIRHAVQIHFEDCTFTRLGGAGLTFDLGSQGCIVNGCRFDDLSGAALAIGNVTGAYRQPVDEADAVRGHVIRNSFIAHTGVEYPDTPAIFVGYAGGIVIEKNEIFDTPYSGISIGWGWGRDDSAVSRDNLVHKNEIHHTMRILNDGGGIYTLGAQPGSIIRDNYLHDQGETIAGIYLDNGTQFYTVYRNVIARSPFWGFMNACCQQEVPPPPPSRNNVAFANISSGPNGFANNQPPYDPMHCSNRVCQNTVPTTSWATLGGPVIQGAGLSGAYRALHPPNAAVGRPATASSSAGPGWLPARANDGDMMSGWRPQPPIWPETEEPPVLPYWQVDLGAPREVREVEIVTEFQSDAPDARRNFVVLASNDPGFATHLVLGHQGRTPLPWRSIWSARTPTPVSARYIRVAKTTPGAFSLADVRVLVLPDMVPSEDEESDGNDPMPPVPCPPSSCPEDSSPNAAPALRVREECSW